jgi:hypothetical protein
MRNFRSHAAKKPLLGWAVAAVCVGLTVVLWVRRGSTEDFYSPDRMQEMVTIKFTDTGDEIEMPRGRLDRELRRSGGVLDPSKGVVNPKTGQPTGFPFNKNEWEQWIKRINEERAAVQAATPAAGNKSENRPMKVVRESPTAPKDGAAAPAEPK